jgi:asparagine synthase (glutamine-hydrolysing)
MCGIIGVLNLSESRPIQDEDLRQMLAMIRHRGPDGFGVYLDEWAGLGNARLSIIDLSGGDQPISNEDGSLWIVFNGEIFNYVELRAGLEQRGHRFSTQSDTEVILHLYEESGPGCLQNLNGQFAIAVWDSRQRTLFLARDRLGIRPLFYTVQGGQMIFASEIKAILAYRGIAAELDPTALDQVFTFWSPLSPRSVFKGIFEVPPAHYVLAKNGNWLSKPYWTLDFTPESVERPLQDHLDEFESLLVDATRIRLRADVPVGAYLSGGLDSSTIAAIIRNYTGAYLDTFSIAFSDPEFDESPYQRRMADFLRTEHKVVFAEYADIGAIFPQVIWHAETPVLRTAPAPMFLLSGLVRANDYKVVLTGEGADEFLAGYDIFKEAKICLFWSQQVESQSRPRLLQRLYPDIANMPNSTAYLASFFGDGLKDTSRRDYSHANRWRTTSRCKRFLAQELSQKAEDYSLDFPESFDHWPPLGKAQYLEASIFLAGYLLSSQGDRMAMSHSVEGRYPFLDHRVVEFCNRLPPHMKLLGLREKYLLKRLAHKWLPVEISQRYKRPYRAPIHRSFFNETSPDYVRDLLSPEIIAAYGLFKPESVNQLVRKVSAGRRLGETDDMALAGILSGQLVYHQFVQDFQKPAPVSRGELRRFYSSISEVPNMSPRMSGP